MKFHRSRTLHNSGHGLRTFSFQWCMLANGTMGRGKQRPSTQDTIQEVHFSWHASFETAKGYER